MQVIKLLHSEYIQNIEEKEFRTHKEGSNSTPQRIQKYITGSFNTRIMHISDKCLLIVISYIYHW